MSCPEHGFICPLTLDPVSLASILHALLRLSTIQGYSTAEL